MKGKKVAVDAVGSTHRHKRQKAKKRKAATTTVKAVVGARKRRTHLGDLFPRPPSRTG